MTEERLQWIGIGIVGAVVAVFVFRLVNVARGRGARSALTREAIQDAALVCLGASLMFKGGTTGRVALMAAFVVLLGSVLVKRIRDR